MIYYFYVPNGDNKGKIFYKRTICGLNKFLLAPCFGIPYIRHTTCNLIPRYFQCNLDIRKMFLNFFIHKELMALLDVDVYYV